MSKPINNVETAMENVVNALDEAVKKMDTWGLNDVGRILGSLQYLQVKLNKIKNEENRMKNMRDKGESAEMGKGNEKIVELE